MGSSAATCSRLKCMRVVRLTSGGIGYSTQPNVAPVSTPRFLASLCRTLGLASSTPSQMDSRLASELIWTLQRLPLKSAKVPTGRFRGVVPMSTWAAPRWSVIVNSVDRGVVVAPDSEIRRRRNQRGGEGVDELGRCFVPVQKVIGQLLSEGLGDLVDEHRMEVAVGRHGVEQRSVGDHVADEVQLAAGGLAACPLSRIQGAPRAKRHVGQRQGIASGGSDSGGVGRGIDVV